MGGRGDGDRACWAIVTRLSLYKEEKTEPVEPPADATDPPGLIPAAASSAAVKRYCAFPASVLNGVPLVPAAPGPPTVAIPGIVSEVVAEMVLFVPGHTKNGLGVMVVIIGNDCTNTLTVEKVVQPPSVALTV